MAADDACRSPQVLSALATSCSELVSGLSTCRAAPSGDACCGEMSPPREFASKRAVLEHCSAPFLVLTVSTTSAHFRRSAVMEQRRLFLRWSADAVLGAHTSRRGGVAGGQALFRTQSVKFSAEPRSRISLSLPEQSWESQASQLQLLQVAFVQACGGQASLQSGACSGRAGAGASQGARDVGVADMCGSAGSTVDRALGCCSLLWLFCHSRCSDCGRENDNILIFFFTRLKAFFSSTAITRRPWDFSTGAPGAADAAQRHVGVQS